MDPSDSIQSESIIISLLLQYKVLTMNCEIKI